MAGVFKKSEDDVRLPGTTYELIDWLDKAYPPSNILPPMNGVDPMVSYAAAQRLAGQRDLVDELIAMREEEKEADKDDQAL